MSSSGVLLSGYCGRSVPRVPTISFILPFLRPLPPSVLARHLAPACPPPPSDDFSLFLRLFLPSSAVFSLHSAPAARPCSSAGFFPRFPSGRAFLALRLASASTRANANGRVNLTKVQYADDGGRVTGGDGDDDDDDDDDGTFKFTNSVELVARQLD